MIKHLVLVCFRSDVPETVKASIYQQLSELKTHVEGMVGFEAGPNVSPETELSKGFKDMFIVNFENAESRDIYLGHPLHKAAGQRLVEHLEGGLEGIVVFDLEI